MDITYTGEYTIISCIQHAIKILSRVEGAMYKKISDYGIIGNLSTVALIARDGSIDWLCLPYIDSPSVFGALLDDGKGGRFSLTPSDEWDSVAEYVPGTNILKTRFRTRTGVVELTDFMPVPETGVEGSDVVGHELYRHIAVLRGKVELALMFQPRPDYARKPPVLEKKEGGVRILGGQEQLFLSCTRDIDIKTDEVSSSWHLSEGEQVWLHLQQGSGAPRPVDEARARKALRDTGDYWRKWLKSEETGLAPRVGPYQDMIDRSALVLKLLYFHATGAIAAAATTSLPEEIGGIRNWDYRFTWVRDTSFTLRALFDLGHLSETKGYMTWIKRVLSEHGADKLQIMYGLRGEEDLPEEELSHLEGYKGSKPVRIGNEAAGQVQLDIYGELMDAALKLSGYVGKIDADLWPFLRDICDHVVGHWRDADSGIWEFRGGPRHFVFSKVMCWVALDRGIIIAQRYGFPAPLAEWERVRAEIREEVLDRGWSAKKGSFVQHYDTDELDATNLLIPLVGFLPFDDPRMVSTIEATQRELGSDGFLHRYGGEDGLPGGEGVFLLCSFWLVECLIALKRLDEAETLLRNMEGFANHLGLFSEEYDVEWQEALGNVPQAFTHIGYISSVLSLRQAREKLAGSRPEKGAGELTGRSRKGLIILNDGKPGEDVPPREIVFRIKNAMNVLRGAFFDTIQGRVAYERMRESAAYSKYVELTYSLKRMDLDSLKTREEQLAFWINLYNVIVIHGVVELGISDSVKEVGNFFGRIQYQVGEHLFCAQDIEHGILRGNRRPPYHLLPVFRADDPRTRYTIKQMDPRIHFALVCASSSCPPIETYTAENLEQDLIISGKAFVNGGGVVIDRERKKVSLSRVFKWYSRDFGNTVTERLRFLAPFLYEPEDRAYLTENADRLTVGYQDYDWRLNRS
jgi:GH15 family glucan-1,4-alpha-glucosidase